MFTWLDLPILTNLDIMQYATNMGNIKLVFVMVKETILQNALQESGIL
jgi:hypothetical protein